MDHRLHLGIADDVLRDLYVRGKYRDVILPMTVLRRFDALLEDSKQAVLAKKRSWTKSASLNRTRPSDRLPGNPSTTPPNSRWRPALRANRQQLQDRLRRLPRRLLAQRQEILNNFEFRNQIARLSRADVLGTLIEKLTSPEINLSPEPRGKHPGLDTHAMGTIFEELVRKFNEENNEEAGEHWTPRDAVRLMAKLIFLPIADRLSRGRTCSTMVPAVPVVC